MLATMAFLMIIISFAQTKAGVEDALRESMLVDEKNPIPKKIRTGKDLDEMENMGLVTGEKVLEREAKASKETTKLTLTEGTDGTKRKGVKQKKGNLTRKERVPKRDDVDAKLWERLAKEKSKDKEGTQGEFKEEQIDANLWDKLVLEQAKRNKSSIVEEAIARAAKEKKDQEEDRKLEEDVSLLTETDWAEAINFLQMEQFSSRQGQYFHFLKLY